LIEFKVLEFMTKAVVNFRSLARAASTATGRALRVMMVLSLWHAPIPWVHVHEIAGPAVERLASLSQHVAVFHARDLSWGNTSLDWHTHLVLPWCLNHQHNCPADDDRDPGSDDILGCTKVIAGAVVASQAFGQPTTRAFLADGILADEAALIERATGTGSGQVGPSQIRHFFETYGCSVAVRDLMSVRLC
jgi:hypothetical protein